VPKTYGIGTFSRDGGDGDAFAGIVIDEVVFDLRPALGDAVTTLALVQDWDASLARLAALADGDRAALGEGTPIGELRPLPPVASGQVLCAGANYTQHLIQMRSAFERRGGSGLSDEELREEAATWVRDRHAKGEPFVFAGLPSALSGADDDVVLWGPGVEHDWELELAIVISKPAWQVARADAMDHVAGYTISNDVSTRDVMNRPGFPMTDFVATKLRPGFFPTGPYLVPRDFVADPYDLRILLKVNGEPMQDESTDDIIFGIDRIIEHASSLVPLQPGDLVLTGSPAGNAEHHGGRWLKPGDVMEGTITGLGVQRNRCVAPVVR
jgi:2,4-diketo-3-deoxy-L-fuconate hydrolase